MARRRAGGQRWGFEQTLYGNENHIAGTPSLPHLKALLVDAAVRGHAVALGDCSGAFYQAPLTEENIFLEPPPEAGVESGFVWEALCAFPGLKGAPKAWEEHSAKELEKLGLDRGRYDGCLFVRFADNVKAGRHADDFMTTGPAQQLDQLMADLGEKLKLRDVVKLYRPGDEGTFLSMRVRRIEGGFTIKGKDSMVDDILQDLGLEDAKATIVPETKVETKSKDDEQKLEASDQLKYRRCVGKLLQLAPHRADIQHGIGVLSRGMANPTLRDQQRLKKMARYLIGTRDVELALVPGTPSDEVVQVYVDADWSDKKEDRRSTSGGILLYHGCVVASWSRRQACLALSSAESELYALGSGAVEALGFATMLGEWREQVVPTLYSDSSSALHVVKKRGPGRMKHIELRCLALQQWREEKRLLFGKVGTDENVSDMLTKPMPKERLIKLASMVGLRGGPYS